MAEYSHNGVSITMDTEGMFVARMEDEVITKPLLVEVRKAIDESLKAQAGSQAKLALPVVFLDKVDGQFGRSTLCTGVLTGMHRSRGVLMITPTTKGLAKTSNPDHIMADTPYNRFVLRSYLDAQAEAAEWYEKMKAKSFKGVPSYQLNPVSHANHVESLKKAHAAQLATKEGKEGKEGK